MAIHVTKEDKSSDTPTKVQCTSCIVRGRRGAMATFKSTDSHGVYTWTKRHAKH